METIEVRSKSYVIKWVNASENSTIHYEVRPIKKSINFCIYTYKEGEEPFQHENNASLITKNKDHIDHHRKRSNTATSTSSSLSGLSLEQKLANAHLVKHHDLGRLNGDELRKGETFVNKSTVFAFVFDNTFSKTTGKKVLFTQYSDVDKKENFKVPQTLDNLVQIIPGTPSGPSTPYINGRVSSSGSSIQSFKRPSLENTTSIQFDLPKHSEETLRVKGGRYLQGFLLKKRRKKTGKNFNKRFFTLNFKYGILNYYLNDKSKHVRGNMFIKYVGITADKKKKLIVLDSGLEIWTLKAITDEDFNTWVQAFNAIKQEGHDPYEEAIEYEQSLRTISDRELDDDSIGNDSTEDLIKDLEILQVKIESLRTRCLALNKSLETPHMLTSSDRQASSSTTASTTSNVSRKSSFWRKKKTEPTTPSREAPMSSPTINVPKTPRTPKIANINTNLSNNTTLYESELLKDELTELNNMILQLINQQKFRVHNNGLSNPRHSIAGNSVITTAANSIFSQEFYDANEYVNELNSGVLMINNNDSDLELENKNSLSGSPITEEDEDEEEEEDEETSIPGTDVEDNSISSSDEEVLPHPPVPQLVTDHETDYYPLTEISGKTISRRKDIPPSTCAPPSILSFVRKNIGKDLSTISVPVTSNEPLTVLQKYAELFEYADLLNGIMNSNLETGERILRVAVFATSSLSSLRSKERNNRKPFNPLLGETYELVREDLGMRLISEKVSHRPPIFAMYADCEDWSFQYAPSPAQKFWSKNAEVINKGVAKLTFKKKGEVYQWSQPITLLKNIIAGEKYTEPSSSLTVTSSTGQRAVVEFKQGGMFSGRSEELTMTAFDQKSKTLPDSVVGTWTEKLALKRGKDTHEIWHCGKLIKDSNKKYGFTEFAASLNEITPIERGKLAPTDSRLRPDLKNYEIGEVDKAEELKLKLEQDQRDRRTKGVPYEPQFFDKIGEDNYQVKKGELNYWERRKRGDWEGLLKLW